MPSASRMAADRTMKRRKVKASRIRWAVQSSVARDVGCRSSAKRHTPSKKVSRRRNTSGSQKAVSGRRGGTQTAPAQGSDHLGRPRGGAHIGPVLFGFVMLAIRSRFEKPFKLSHILSEPILVSRIDGAGEHPRRLIQLALQHGARCSDHGRPSAPRNRCSFTMIVQVEVTVPEFHGRAVARRDRVGPLPDHSQIRKPVSLGVSSSACLGLEAS